MDDRELKARAAKIEVLVREIESFEDPEVRATTSEVLQALLQLYGQGLARVLDIVARRDQAAVSLLAQDELIAHLLFLHGLHPVPIETRVATALEEVRPYLQAHGGNVALLSVERGIARLQLHGNCNGCPSSALTLKQMIEDAIQKAAPDLEGIEVDDANELQPGPIIIPLSALSRP